MDNGFKLEWNVNRVNLRWTFIYFAYVEMCPLISILVIVKKKQQRRKLLRVRI